jgi:tetratricopeptide (TPR) repeat protein
MTRPKTSDRAVQDELREAMRAAGLSHAEIAADFGRRFRVRPRTAWRVACGWTLRETTDRINDLLRERGLDRGGRAGMTPGHLCEYEQWPGPAAPDGSRRADGRKPTPQLLSLLARLYDTTVASLLDFDDYRWMPEAERLFYGTGQAPGDNHDNQVPNGNAVAVPHVAGRSTPGRHITPGARPVIYAPPLARHGRVAVDAPPGFAYRQIQDAGPGGFWTLNEVIMAAAHEGGEHAERAERRDIGESTLEQIRADVIRLSHDLMIGEPFPVFLELRRVRTRVYAMLERQVWPRDARDLYLTTGCLNGLMASAANNLGYPQAAEELIRAGWAYAIAADHRPLMAYLRERGSHVAYRSGRPRQARDLAERGLEYSRGGQTAACLYLYYARAMARLGDADAARQAIAEGDEARQRKAPEGTGDLLAFGGDLMYSRATQHYHAGTALAEIPGAATDAISELTRAAESYAAGPEPGEDHSRQAAMRAHADLATVRLRAGRLDAAAAALGPVMALSPGNRTGLLSQRLTAVHAELAAPIYQGSATARDLGEQIEEWLGDTITGDLAALPSVSG